MDTILVALLLAAVMAATAIVMLWIHRGHGVSVDSSVRFWPPRLKTIILHPTSAISFQHLLTELSGTLTIPSRSLEGDSHRVKLVLRRRERVVSKDQVDSLRVRATAGRGDIYFVESEVPLLPQTGSLIEGAAIEELSSRPTPPLIPPSAAKFNVELLAPGCELAGASGQSLSLQERELMFYWGLLFRTPGTCRVALVFRVLETREGEQLLHQLGSIERDVVVRRFGFLTGRAMANVAWIAGGVAGLLAALKLLKELGWVKL